MCKTEHEYTNMCDCMRVGHFSLYTELTFVVLTNDLLDVNMFLPQAMANYELAADYYKGEESNRYALSYEFMSMLVSKESLQCFDTVGWMRGMASGL